MTVIVDLKNGTVQVQGDVDELGELVEILTLLCSKIRQSFLLIIIYLIRKSIMRVNSINNRSSYYVIKSIYRIQPLIMLEQINAKN